MFPSAYHRLESTLDVHLATSRDGWNWSRPERCPIVERELGGGSYNCVYASPNLVPLGADWALPCRCYSGLHDWARHRGDATPDGEFRWARWRPGRLVALEAAVEGTCTLTERVCQGKELRLNYQTETGGWIKVGLAEPPSTPPAPVQQLEGYEVEACDGLEGDEVSRAATWKGNGDLAAFAGQRIAVRIQMAKARLFSVSL